MRITTIFLLGLVGACGSDALTPAKEQGQGQGIEVGDCLVHADCRSLVCWRDVPSQPQGSCVAPTQVAYVTSVVETQTCLAEGPGTRETPFCTIAQAQRTLLPYVRVAPGIYDGVLLADSRTLVGSDRSEKAPWGGETVLRGALREAVQVEQGDIRLAHLRLQSTASSPVVRCRTQDPQKKARLTLLQVEVDGSKGGDVGVLTDDCVVTLRDSQIHETQGGLWLRSSTYEVVRSQIKRPRR